MLSIESFQAIRRAICKGHCFELFYHVGARGNWGSASTIGRVKSGIFELATCMQLKRDTANFCYNQTFSSRKHRLSRPGNSLHHELLRNGYFKYKQRHYVYVMHPLESPSRRILQFVLAAYSSDGKRIKALLFAMFSPVKLSSHCVGSNIGPILANG